MALAHLDISDEAQLSLNWVSTPALILRAKDKAFVQLAGVTHKLDAVMCDQSRFQGRYLRAKHAYVKTFGTSVAEISALKVQHTLASDGSDIRFYALPVMKTDFMAFNGSVLDMRDWDDPYIKSYHPYNKKLT